MYTIFLALGVTLLTILLPLPFGLGPVWTTLPGIILGVLSFVWVNRRVARRVESVVQAADAELAGLQQLAQRPGPGTQAAMARRFDNAVELLKRGFIFAKWQVGVTTMLNARIGMLLFMRWMVLGQGGLSEAIPYLERSRIKGKKARLLAAMWPAWAMLAVCYYKGRKDLSAARAVLEDAVGVAGKESVLWGLYAWILWSEDQLDDAIAVLARGKAALPDDPRITENLTALQNRKPMKMRAYGEQWYQFGLEKPKMAGVQPQMPHPRMKGRGGVRRR